MVWEAEQLLKVEASRELRDVFNTLSTDLI